MPRTRVRVENCRQFGGPWLALELVKRLGLHEFLQRTLPAGQEHVPGRILHRDWMAAVLTGTGILHQY